MFLKRLEVVGFKSFADRIGIDFVPGVTAVVGPNGSGKSNVTDAIRWVLGEQSAKSLRGSKMEDVIFAGSASRKPLNFAEVTLILNNEDEEVGIPYSEISVTRRVYRSGESEYLLNNQQCRLKDITDLFMDSGLGKEAFSIISQGRVDEILNSKPDDRRTIFEEAAGILKYKLRKKKAEQKLLETDDNLHRVLDILHELDSRLEPLKIQSSAAKDYLHMTEELKELDMSLIVHDLKEHHQELLIVKEEHEQLEQQEQNQASEIANLQTKMDELRTKIHNIDETIDAAQERLVEASAEVERWEGRKALMQEKRSNAEKQFQQLQLALKEAKEEEMELAKTEEENKKLFDLKKNEIQQLKAEIKQLDVSLNSSVSQIEQQIEEYKNLYIDLLNEEATAKNELKHIEQQLAQYEETEERMNDRSEEMLKKLKQVSNLKNELAQKLEYIRNKVSDVLEQYEQLQRQLNAATSSFEEKQRMLYQAYQHQQQLKSRKEAIEELESDFSGFNFGVKEILLARERGELKGIEGAVLELLKVEGKYSKAIETALGAATQHIVTNTEQDAQKAIGWLKAKKAGRATFLPKNVMKSRKLSTTQIQEAMNHPAYIQLAHELVEFDEHNRNIVEYLLGNVLVAENLEGASQIARLCGYKYRVVTLDGDIVNAGGSLTGGSVKQQNSLFTRKAELEQLKKNLSQIEQSIYQAEKTLATEKETLTTLREQVELLKVQSEQYRQEEMELHSKYVELELEEKNLKNTVNLASSEKSSASSRREALLKQKSQTEERLAELNKELQKVNDKVEQLSKAKIQSETEKDLLREQSAEKRSELAVLQEQLNQLQIQTADIALKRSKVFQQMESISREIEWIQNERDNHLTDEEIEQAISEWAEKRDQYSFTIQENRQLRIEYQQQLSQLDEQFKELQRIHKGFLEQLRSIDVKKSRIEFEINRLTNLLEEEYEIDFDEAKNEAVELDDVEQIRKKVKLLKQSIEELGPVNLTAIEEYERVLERHTFLTEQRNDLIEAQQTLNETIREMDEEMATRFKESFEKIQLQFREVFRELFGGGHADLILLDPNNLLETGIEIVAQPPGKKLQSLSLLSGGERALTAIALLFAILNSRPVPFVILDEVEAALDEANVERYSTYLKKLSRDTQFIVITHRKGTMEGADVLYGITMQESGVSKLVSVKLEDEVVLVGQRSE
ncbi:chromosome segregation protein SMC [Ureibacillus thermosphaericus]|uniref:Chromosome partition protein Smc n=1 Tax=Ureibacillus thermosphaericus TaxID=51173 RepID=A0A840PX48_URETH|nr:chromosome segregation protein SMC [Ureibacillus thermosphaericus]MBB5149894.1 chromosome segregation protein [Ureibacillus thermosphaericus]NKZ30946.1 chromosome segregation protein SMC [Ureibacillus thermosphaericus]